MSDILDAVTRELAERLTIEYAILDQSGATVAVERQNPYGVPDTRPSQPDAVQAASTQDPAPTSERDAEAPCPFCHLATTRCAALNETRLDDWRALHHNDPNEVTRRDEEATAEMFESLRRHGTHH